MLKMKRYRMVRQHDGSDCGAACLATIFAYYGLKLSVAIIREMAGTDTEGTNALGLIKAVRRNGIYRQRIQSHPGRY